MAIHRLCLILLMFTPGTRAWAEPPPDAGVRKTTPLAGPWTARFADEPETQWREVPLPLDAQAARNWNKPAVFRTEFQFRGDEALRPRFIQLSRVMGLARIEVNGQSVGEYRGFYRLAYASEFGRPRKYLIPEGAIKPGANTVTIHVAEDKLWKPGYPLGGIQGVPELICAGIPFISAMDFAIVKPDEVAEYAFSPTVAGARAEKVGLLIERFTGENPYSGPAAFVSYEETPLTGSAPARVSWKSRPHFATYRAQVILRGQGGKVLDSESYRFHTVSTEVKGGDVLLNNEKFLGRGAVSLGAQLITEPGLTYCNWFNFNLIRLDFLGRDYLDPMWRHGVLCMELVCFSVTELPRVWNPKFPEDTLRLVRPVIEEYAEHPAIVYWNSANEVSNADAAFLGALYDLYKEHDPYKRPVTYAGIPSQEIPDGQDVMGVNYGNTLEALKTYVEHAKGKPVFSTEWRVNPAPDRLRQYWSWLQALNFAGGTEYGTVAMIGRSSTPDWDVATQGHKWMYRDLDLSGFVDRDGSHVLDVKNVSTSPVRNLTVHKATTGDRYVVKELAAGASVPVPIGKDVPVDHTRRATFFLRYTTHHGLPHNTFDEIAFRAR